MSETTVRAREAASEPKTAGAPNTADEPKTTGEPKTANEPKAGGEPKAAAPRHNPKVVIALRNFAMSMSVFNILGYAVLGFEQPWVWPFIALATAYSFEIFLETISATLEKRTPRYRGNGVRGMVEFLYPSHITGLAMNMLIYVNDEVWVMVFGVMVAVGAKWVLRAPVKGKLRHFMNPSNFGISIILLLFPWASIAPPYHFTERVTGVFDWLIPVGILMAGTMLNSKLTGRMWLIMGWLITYVAQAVFRGIFFGTSIPAALIMMTGVAFVLYTNYMVTDPGTSPSKPASQFAFGSGIAVIYGFFTGVGIAYGLFFATALVCLIRGCFLWSLHFSNKSRERRAPLDGARSEDAGPGAVKHDTDSNGKKVVNA